MVTHFVHNPAAATTHEVSTEDAVTTNVNLKQLPGKTEV